MGRLDRVSRDAEQAGSPAAIEILPMLGRWKPVSLAEVGYGVGLGRPMLE
jgi:hypothetical protein